MDNSVTNRFAFTLLNHTIQRWILLALMLAFVGCAGRGSPGGGPEDTTPPIITAITPVSGSVNVPANTEIVIEFSEPIDELSLISSVFVSPHEENLKFKVRGRRLIISPKNGIPADRPMTVTIGSGLKDLHGNRLPGSLSFAFTSGDSIRGGGINGRIYGDPPFSGMFVGAWVVTDSLVIAPDTILPDYLTQAGEYGEFYLNYLSEGTYRVLCWEDKNRDRFFQPGLDRIGIPSRDVAVLLDSTIKINLYATKQDTAKFLPLILLATDQSHVQLRFSRKPVNTKSPAYESLLNIIDSTGNSLNVFASWPDPTDSTRIIFLTNSQISGMIYRATYDTDTIAFEFKGSSEVDTIGPHVVSSHPAKDAKGLSANVNGYIAFDDKLVFDSISTIASLFFQDSVTIPIEISISEPNTIRWHPTKPLPEGSKCIFSINLGKISDSQGNRAADTTITIFFTTIDLAVNGEISGQVKFTGNPKVFVAAKRIGNAKLPQTQIQANSDGTFMLRRITPGEYSVWCWNDSNHNGIFDPGTLLEYSASEPFYVLQDTITVRARWESSGVILKLP